MGEQLKILEGKAVLLYGALTLLLLFAFGWYCDSRAGMSLAVIATALTYFFQTAVFEDGPLWMLRVLNVLVVFAAVLSGIFSLGA